MIEQLQPKLLGISNRLLEYLAPEEERKLTKLEAFRDLLEMATHFKGHVECFGQEFDLVPGEIVTSISELAKKWRWQRATVRKFVDTLVEMGQVIHTPHVKCSRMELVTLRFKWLPCDHPQNLLHVKDFNDKTIPVDDFRQLTRPVIRQLSDLYSKDATEMKYAEDPITYTAEQRSLVASLYIEAMMLAYTHIVTEAYTYGAEKSLLDTFFKICHGSEEEMIRLTNAIINDEGHNINLMVWETMGDTRDSVTRILTHLFRELSERLPVDYTPTDSEDKPTETDGVPSQEKKKSHTDDNK